MSVFAGLSFATPWILLGLIVLPAIYFLLRVTPPAPRRVPFPPLRLLQGLSAEEETPARTPLWLLLLRMAAAALIVLALAEPMLGEIRTPLASGPLVIFVDNGWPAAHAWSDRVSAMSDALTGAGRTGRPVAIVPTASVNPPSVSLLDAGQAARAMRELEPQPWLPDRRRAAAALAKAHFDSAPQILWLSDGLAYNDTAAVAESLSRLGHVTVFRDALGKMPLALRAEANDATGFRASIIRAGTNGERQGDVTALGPQGEELARAHFRFARGSDATTAKLSLPLEVRNETQRIVIANDDSAGAVRLMDSGAKRRAVTLVSASNMESEQPLLSDLYYLERALAPYAELHKGTIADAVNRHSAALVLADIGKIGGADRDRVAQFVSDGGMLIRFAGGRMTENVDDLIPVKLRTGGRYLGGALAWSEPQHLAPFPEASPFRGLAISREVTVSRQVLAEPSVELSERSWARLADGTPLVTASQRGKGWIVLFHVTASPAWSSLPLSGLYVQMLRRLLDMAGGARPSDVGVSVAAVFPPVATLDGFGRLQKPPPEALPIHGSQLRNLRPSPTHPPGLYGTEGSEIAINTVAPDDILTPMGDLGLAARTYAGSAAIALQAPLLALAILILLADAVISLWLRGYLAHARRWFAIGAGALLLLCVAPPDGRADDTFDMKAALGTHLAYVVTGIPDVDDTSKAGLTGLGLYLKARTSYDPGDPIGVDIARDDLSFFPLIYWPMDPREHDLSPQALSKLSDYMRNGGTIFFDTRDLTLGSSRGADSPGQQTLRRLVGKLDLPPLQPVPSDHVLTKSFYLLQDFPGRWEGGKVWVEALPPPDPDAGPEPARGGDGVSPVIIGGNDWAAAWAVDATGQPIADVSGGAEQREMAVRFGINVAMYALTGNYKTDQIHVPALLQRMGH